MCTWEKNVHSVVVGCSVLYIAVGPSWFSVVKIYSLRTPLPHQKKKKEKRKIFCLRVDLLSTCDTHWKVGYWHFQLIVSNCLLLPSNSVNFCFIYFRIQFLYVYSFFIFFIYWPFIIVKCPSLSLCNSFCLKVYFVWNEYNHPNSWFLFLWCIFFQNFTFSLFVSLNRKCVLWTACSLIMFLCLCDFYLKIFFIIVDLQCCAYFCCTAKWPSHTYLYIYQFCQGPPFNWQVQDSYI